MDSFHIVNSSATIQLSDPNTANLVYVTIAIVVITAIGIGITSWLTRKSLLETRRSNDIMNKEIMYAHTPAITLRWRQQRGSAIKELGFQNVGNGTALNINIIVRDSNGNKLTKEPPVKGFAFTPSDGISWTGIDLSMHQYLNVEYHYEDILYQKYDIRRREDVSYILGMPEYAENKKLESSED